MHNLAILFLTVNEFDEGEAGSVVFWIKLLFAVEVWDAGNRQYILSLFWVRLHLLLLEI